MGVNIIHGILQFIAIHYAIKLVSYLEFQYSIVIYFGTLVIHVRMSADNSCHFSHVTSSHYVVIKIVFPPEMAKLLGSM